VTVAGADLAKGTNIHATLVAHDAAGNSASVTADHPYSVDTTPPVASLTIDKVAGDDIVNLAESQSPQTISGKAGGEFQIGDLVKFTLNGTEYSAAVTNTAGDWSVTVAGADLAKETSINAILQAHDAAGNVSDVSASHAYSVDVTPPVATLNINVVAGDDIVNLEESKTQQTISGKAGGEFKVGDMVTFILNGNTYSAAVINTAGDWSVQVAGSDLAKGTSINATLVAHDAAGNSASVTTNHPYSVDVTPPVVTLTINTVAGDDVLNAAEAAVMQTVSGKASGEFLVGDLVKFTLNGTEYSAAITNTSGDWSVQVAGSDLAKATNIHATLTTHDAAGNIGSAEADHGYVVKLHVEPTKIDNVWDNDGPEGLWYGWSINDTTPLINGEGVKEEGAIVHVFIDGVEFGTTKADSNGYWWFEVPADKALAEGDYLITATVEDWAGNTSDVSQPYPINIDLTPPSPPSIDKVIDNDTPDHPIDVPRDGKTDDYTPLLVGSGAEPHNIIHIFDGARELGTTEADEDGNWSYQVSDLKGLSWGDHNFTAKAEDPAGNISKPSVPYAVELLARPTIDSVYDDVGSKQGNLNPGDTTDDTQPKISGKAESNSVVTIYDKNVAIGSTTADASGHWTFTPTTPLANGGHDLTVKSTDLGGEPSLPSDAFGFTVQVGSSGVEEFDSYVGQKSEFTFASGLHMKVLAGSYQRYDTPQGTDAGPIPLTPACLNEWTGKGSVRFDIPGGGAQTVGVEVGRLTGGAPGPVTGTVLEAYDADGVLLGSSTPPGTVNFYQWYPLSVTAPAGKLVAYVVLINKDPGGSLIDHFTWSTPLQAKYLGALASEVTTDHSVADATAAEHGALAASSSPNATTESSPLANQESNVPEQTTAAPTSDSDASTYSIDSSESSAHLLQALGLGVPAMAHAIGALADTYYGANEASVVTLKYAADQYLASDANQGIHGGSGVDILEVQGHEQVLDLTLATSAGKVTGMEVIDLKGDGGNTLKLSLKDVLDNGQADLFHSTEKHNVQMMVQGDGNDVVNLDHLSRDGQTGEWTDKGAVNVGGTSYEVYQHSSLEAELLVQQGVHVNLV